MIEQQLRERCRQLLADGTVQVVIGYGQDGPGKAAYPVFIRDAAEADKLVWNEQCQANLATYLTRKEIKALGKPAIVLKGCDARALVVLAKESQIDRENIHAIGIACQGVGRNVSPPNNEPAAKCSTCDVHNPQNVDEVIGQVAQPEIDPAARYAELEAFLAAKSPAERMQYWQAELERCFKCYACRQVCPMCYCERCIVDKNRPQVIDTSATLTGNFAWHITRAFHQAGRCIGCDECTRACPAGINLRLLTLTMSSTAEAEFNYRPGHDPAAEPVIGAWSQQDKEEFIR